MNGPGNTKAFEHAEGTYVVVNGINMYYEQYGEGDPILLIHDNGGSVESFDAQINYLSRKHKVIVADSRAHGNTGNNADSLTYELMAEDYYLLLQQLELDSVMVLGWGDGAIIGLLISRDYPGSVSRLAIAGAHLQADTSAVEPKLLGFVRDELDKYSDSVKAGKKQYMNQVQQLKLILHHPNIDAESLADIQVPVLVMSGDRDFIKLTHTLEIFQALPNAQLSVFPGTTHFVMYELTQVFNNTLLRFFARPFTTPDSVDQLGKQKAVQVNED